MLDEHENSGEEGATQPGDGDSEEDYDREIRAVASAEDSEDESPSFVRVWLSLQPLSLTYSYAGSSYTISTTTSSCAKGDYSSTVSLSLDSWTV
jgi:hypothetical protein